MARLRKKPVAAPVREPALFVECEWLVVAIDAGLIERILLVSDTTTRTAAGGELTVIDTGAAWVPAWDLDGMLGSEPGRGGSWIVVRAPETWPIPAFALRTGRCVCVRAMPRSTDLPPGLVELGAGALRSAFATSTIPELSGYSTGVVLDPLRILREDQIARAAEEIERA
ncbi:MAG TPA: hypothetical protein VK932_28895 [Kofleriaceae bacterium]|nr:hypothetical protein [Kofleriaceae bacterium]